MQTKEPWKGKDVLGRVGRVCSLDCGDGVVGVCERPHLVNWHTCALPCISLMP